MSMDGYSQLLLMMVHVDELSVSESVNGQQIEGRPVKFGDVIHKLIQSEALTRSGTRQNPTPKFGSLRETVYSSFISKLV